LQQKEQVKICVYFRGNIFNPRVHFCSFYVLICQHVRLAEHMKLEDIDKTYKCVRVAY
jgi:hypothetical protein